MPKLRIFALQLAEIVSDNLYAVIYSQKKTDCFAESFGHWADVEYLENFFEQNKSDLKQSVESAVFRTIEEARQFEADILACAQGKIPEKNLDNYIFLPLHKNEDLGLPLQHSKAYGTESGRSFLRLYAIRLEDCCYIVTGGAIKLTRSMQERAHTNEEMDKLKAVARFLQEKGLYDSFDIGTLIIE